MNIYERVSYHQEQERGLRLRVEILRNKTVKAVELLDELEETLSIVQYTSGHTKESFRTYINTVVSEAIGLMFPGYSFRLDFVERRNRTEADLWVVDADGNLGDPISAFGGGLVDITSFALRIICYSCDHKAPLLVLDEPFRFVSRDLLMVAADILKKVAEDWGVQIILVTHEEEFIHGDNIFTIIKEKGISKVKY
jgi:DNA repair exonuclease SbcCD ATPase subunit